MCPCWPSLLPAPLLALGNHTAELFFAQRHNLHRHTIISFLALDSLRKGFPDFWSNSCCSLCHTPLTKIDRCVENWNTNNTSV